MAAQNTLKRYRAKRNFAITSEPPGGDEAGNGARTFVVQKHWARHLHYDFRLELDGTMKSWAVPKGPSFDAKDKRMAVHVEDHPIAYSSFEGTISPKQYGAGKVMIWDNGTWHPLGDPHKGYDDGNLKFELRGQKLHGRWVLVRIKGKVAKQDPWLLIKEKDAFVRASTEFSVVDERPESVKPLPAPAPSTTGVPPAANKAPLPATLAPQLATMVDGPPSDPEDWIYEIKFDGYRLLTRVDGAEIKLFTRNGNDWTSKLVPLQQSIATMRLPPGWYDGEIVAPDEDGRPDFGAVQQLFESGNTREIVLYLFDIPYFDGYDMRAVPLASRRAVLQGILAKLPSEHVRFSEAFNAPLQSVIASACKLGLEGIVAKRSDSIYVSRRSSAWIKLKCSQRQEFVIGGYTDPQGARSGIGSLLLGVHDDNGAFKYAGKVGTGFNQRMLMDLRMQLDALAASTNPFASAPRIEGRPHWVQPKLVAEVSFGEWTRAGRIRHAVFHGLRIDKGATGIVRDKAASVKKAPMPGRATGKKSQALSSRLRITHPERVIDVSTGITKIELIRYYGLVGDLMMEHLKRRPVSLARAPTGVNGELFFQKHAETEKLSGMRQLDPTLHAGHPAMLEVVTKQGLLSAAQWNVVEFHTLNTTAKSFQHPDRMVFDLDPGEGVPWGQVREAAILVHAFLEQLGLTAFLKTSGGKGLHIVVPVRKLYDWDTIKRFSQAIVFHLAKTIPQRFVAKSGPRNRIGRIFIDALRNGPGATTVCAWSARARPGLGISVPVEWNELESLNGGDHWKVRTAHARLDQGNDPWKGYGRASGGLSAAMKMLASGPASPVRRKRASPNPAQ